MKTLLLLFLSVVSPGFTQKLTPTPPPGPDWGKMNDMITFWSRDGSNKDHMNQFVTDWNHGQYSNALQNLHDVCVNGDQHGRIKDAWDTPGGPDYIKYLVFKALKVGELDPRWCVRSIAPNGTGQYGFLGSKTFPGQPTKKEIEDFKNKTGGTQTLVSQGACR
jgi:hypothetical protein